jgi:hypothetical protein
MLQYVTSRCSAFGHPEIVLQFRVARPVAVETMLLGYLEKGVAAGKQFIPGQTVQVGWATLQLCSRADGRIGVLEQTETGWVESCDASLMSVWMQKEVAASVGLSSRIAFPHQQQRASACNQALTANRWLLTRSPATDEGDSGWFIGCFGETDHGHHRPEVLHSGSLLRITQRLPFLTQFLALPAGSNVFVDGTGARIRPHIFADGDERPAQAGSYLASLLT